MMCEEEEESSMDEDEDMPGLESVSSSEVRKWRVMFFENWAFSWRRGRSAPLERLYTHIKI